MNHHLEKIPVKEVFPGFVGRFIHTQAMTFAFWEIKQGSTVPEHAHVHEQVVNMLEGEFELTVDGQPHHLRPGMVFTIPSQVKHAGRAITHCKILDVFSPVRDDYKF
ncbi:MAG: cupin domain-containing protein [Flammeovirgaceae bacterium]